MKQNPDGYCILMFFWLIILYFLSPVISHKQYHFIVLTACILNTTVKQQKLDGSLYIDKSLCLMCIQ